jgi:hypothetical protein
LHSGAALEAEAVTQSMNALDHDQSLLQRLIIDGEQVLQRRRFDNAQSLQVLEAVKKKREAPFVDGVRVIDDHTMLYASAVSLANKHLNLYDVEKAQKFGRVVAVLIDDIRADFSRAIEQSKRPTA